LSAPGAVEGAAVSVGVDVGEEPTTVGDVPTVGVALAVVPVVGDDVDVEDVGAEGVADCDGVEVCDGVGSEPIDVEAWGVKKTSTK
jgi:hypothetical protein